MKKTLSQALVGSVVLLACGRVDAATVALAGANVYSSVEGNAAAALVNGAASVSLRTMAVTVAGSGYVDGDVVTITFGGGGELRLGSVGTVATSYAAANDVANGGKEVVSCKPAGGATQFKLNLKAVTSTSIQYTVSDRVTGALAANTVCTMPVYDMLASSLTSAKTITMNWSAATAAGVVHDVLTNAEGNPALVASVHASRTQFAVDRVSSATTNIYVNPGLGYNGAFTVAYGPRTTFMTSAGAQTNSETFEYRNRVTGASALLASAQNLLTAANSDFDSETAVYTGNFSFLDNNGNGCTAADLTSGWARASVGGGGTMTISSDCSTLTVTGSPGRTDVITFSVNNTDTSANGSRSIPNQTIALTTTWKKGTTTVGTASPSSSRRPSFSTLGFSAEIPYMPYGSGISRIIYLTNRSGVSGGVALEAYNDAGDYCPSTSFPAVTAVADGVTLLSAAVDAGIAACFGSSFNGKSRIVVTSQVGANSTDSITLSGTGSAASGDDPAAANIGASTALALETEASGTITRSASNVEVYSAYNVNGNRITVINTSNGR